MTAPGAAAFRSSLAAAGLDVLGALAPGDYDAVVPAAWCTAQLHPEAREWLVVASGGRALFAAFESSEFAADGAPDPLDRFVRARLAAACSELAESGIEARAFHYEERRGGAFADFVALGRACGLASPAMPATPATPATPAAASALGLAMHPVYGPWWSIRALVAATASLLEAPFAETGAAELASPSSPCLGCPAPCVSACRGAAVLDPAGGLAFDARACAATRARDAGCAERCDARRACPVGAEFAYSGAAEAHHMRASLAWLNTGSTRDSRQR